VSFIISKMTAEEEEQQVLQEEDIPPSPPIPPREKRIEHPNPIDSYEVDIQKPRELSGLNPVYPPLH
jgi:hypothetical protein